jgi:hypothetical protein
MINALLVVFAIAALVIAGLALEKHTSKVRKEMIQEVEKEEEIVMPSTEVPSEIREVFTEDAPTVSPDVKQMVQAQEAPTSTPAKKRRRGRPAAKKD